MTYVDLLKEAAAALERIRARKYESAEAWAERLAPTFFADLDGTSVIKKSRPAPGEEAGGDS